MSRDDNFALLSDSNSASGSSTNTSSSEDESTEFAHSDIEDKIGGRKVTRFKSMMDDIVNLYSETTVSNSRGKCIIPMNNKLKIVWDILVLILVLVISIIVPTRLAFATSDPIGWVIFYGVTDTLFLLDIIITFFTSINDKDKTCQITNKREIAEAYLKGWFWVDFISILPLDLLIWQ